MWRLANYIYRAFRNVATHRYSQDIIAPLATIHNKDDESNRDKIKENLTKHKAEIDHIIKDNQFSYENFQKLQKYLHKILIQQLILKLHVIKPIEPPKIEHNVKEVQTSSIRSTEKNETLDSLLQADEDCMKTLKNLSDLNEETMSLINNQAAIEALEAGNIQLGIETLQLSVKDGKNAAALYNLGICYEQGIGVEKDRAKACDYYRQASILGHVDASFNLTLLSNHIDINDNEDEKLEQTMTNKFHGFRFSFTKQYQEDQSQSWNDYPYDLTKTLICLS